MTVSGAGIGTGSLSVLTATRRPGVKGKGHNIGTTGTAHSHAQAASASGFGGSPSISPATFSGLVASPSRVDVQHPAVSRDPRTPGGTMPGTPVTALPHRPGQSLYTGSGQWVHNRATTIEPSTMVLGSTKRA